MTTRPATARTIATLAILAGLGACLVAGAIAPPSFRTTDAGDLVARGWSRLDGGARDFIAVAAATSSGIGRATAGPRVRAIEIPPSEGADRGRAASVVELVDGYAWMRLSPQGAAALDEPTPEDPPLLVPVTDWMFTDDAAMQLRAYFPLLTYPFFLTRRVAGGASGTELLVLVEDHSPDRCTVWAVYPGPGEGAGAGAGAESGAESEVQSGGGHGARSAEIAFHRWEEGQAGPATELERIDLPAGAVVRIDLRRRSRPSRPGERPLWYALERPRPRPVDELTASADAPLIAAIRTAHATASRALPSIGDAPPTSRRRFRGFSLDQR